MNLARINERMSNLDGWSLEGECMVKDYEFKDFKEALDFVNKAGEIAEKHKHHPSITLDYNRVRLILTTHEERGLSEKDFNVAEDIDKIGK